MRYFVNESTESHFSVTVMLDGHVVMAAQHADDEMGSVYAPLITAEGRPVFDHGRNDFAVVERRGRVEIKHHDPSPRLAMLRPPTEDYPFHVKLAREGELTPDWNKVRFA